MQAPVGREQEVKNPFPHVNHSHPETVTGAGETSVSCDTSSEKLSFDPDDGEDQVKKSKRYQSDAQTTIADKDFTDSQP